MVRVLILTVLVATASLSLTATRVPAPLAGPSAVIEMHERLFAALDRGDAPLARTFVAESNVPVSVLLADVNGRPVAAEGVEAASALLARLAEERKSAGGTFTTKILKSQADCESERLSYGIFEYEVTHTLPDKTTTQRFTLTSLVHWTKDGMKLFHSHASLAPDLARSRVHSDKHVQDSKTGSTGR